VAALTKRKANEMRRRIVFRIMIKTFV